MGLKRTSLAFLVILGLSLIFVGCTPTGTSDTNNGFATVEVTALKWRCDVSYTQGGSLEVKHKFSKGQKGKIKCDMPKHGRLTGEPVVTYWYNWQVTKLERQGTYQIEENLWRTMSKGDKYRSFECPSKFDLDNTVWCFIEKTD